MNRRSCNVDGGRWDDDCEQTVLNDGTVRYGNSFTSEAMPDALATLVIEQGQHDMKRLILQFEAPDPQDPTNPLVDYERVAYRHQNSGYEEE
jgi:hypothetical protein